MFTCDPAVTVVAKVHQLDVLIFPSVQVPDTVPEPPFSVPLIHILIVAGRAIVILTCSVAHVTVPVFDALIAGLVVPFWHNTLAPSQFIADTQGCTHTE
jgi:hypothetical protein